MDLSECCKAPLTKEVVAYVDDERLSPVYETQIEVQVCSHCGAILFSQKAHRELHKELDFAVTH